MSATAATSLPYRAPPSVPDRRWLLLSLLASAQYMVVLDARRS